MQKLIEYNGWVDIVPDIKFSIDELVKEYHDYIEDKLIEPNEVYGLQKVYSIVENYTVKDIVKSMPETQKALDFVSTIFDFNKVTYRWISRNRAYNWHIDEERLCYHIPLITNDGCWFLYEGKSFHTPADGSLYIVNNGIPHTFVNSGSEPRVHIMFEKLGNDQAIKFRNHFSVYKNTS